jgi:hypothetical protein
MTRPLTRFALPAVLALTGLPQLASAGWDNVFQVCCHDCRPRTRAAFFRSDPCCEPQPQRRVEYQRSYYYEPVTVMKPERYTEEVPVQVKSYYYEPVTTYTRSSYYDPCTGCYQDICVPKTSYVRKEQCSTVMRYVERMRMVPVQTTRKIEVTRPVVTYYYPEQRRYVPDCELSTPAPAPSVERLPSSPPSVTPDRGGSELIPPSNLPTQPQSLPRSMPPGKVNARTTSRPAGPASVRGEVVLSDQVTPRPGAKLVFVNATDLKTREYATADQFGNFDLQLPAGDWFMYVGNGDGKASFQRKITIADAKARNFLVVSR